MISTKRSVSFTGDHSEQEQRLLVKIGKYIPGTLVFFLCYRRFYLLWPPVIVAGGGGDHDDVDYDVVEGCAVVPESSCGSLFPASSPARPSGKTKRRRGGACPAEGRRDWPDVLVREIPRRRRGTR